MNLMHFYKQEGMKRELATSYTLNKMESLKGRIGISWVWLEACYTLRSYPIPIRYIHVPLSTSIIGVLLGPSKKRLLMRLHQVSSHKKITLRS